MAEEIKTTKISTDPSFVCPLDHGMSEEEAAKLKQAQEQAEEDKNELMFTKGEIEDLKRELWESERERKKLEDQGSGEDVGLLEAQVEELKGINEDLDQEVKTLKDQMEQKEDELVFHICIRLILGFIARTIGGEKSEGCGIGSSTCWFYW